MPYSLIATLIVLVIVVRYVALTAAPVRAKAFVTGILLIALVMQFGFTQWWLVGLLLQGALGICLIFHAKARGRAPL